MKKNQQTTIKHAKLPNRQTELTLSPPLSSAVSCNVVCCYILEATIAICVDSELLLPIRQSDQGPNCLSAT